MNTPTHLLISAAVLAKKGDATKSRWINPAILLGALLPDAALFILFIWARLFAGISEAELWDSVYWQQPWQALNAIGNSLPLYLALGALAWGLKRPALLLLALSAVLHLAFDFPFHHDDAHAHLWPISDWRFHSPLSYWDPQHHGDWVSAFEVILALGMIILLWRRFSGRWVKSALIVAATSYVAVPLYFSLMLGSG